jgi:hypothetical protein
MERKNIQIIIFYIYTLLLLTLVSCNFSNKKIYKNLYITNGGEFSDYSVAAIKLDDDNQLNIFPFEVKDYKIDKQYIIFKCVDYYGDEKFYFLDKNFDEYNYEKKITGPLNNEEFETFLDNNKISLEWQ